MLLCTRMGRHALALGSLALFALAFGCVGVLPKETTDARGEQLRACEMREAGERAACFAALTPMREDEPRTGLCMGFVAYIKWAREGAPDCVKELEDDDAHARGPLCSEARPPTVADARQGKALCEARIAKLDRVGQCLRTWRTPYENVQGASVSCYVKVASERKAATTQLAVLERIIAELEPSLGTSSSAPPSSSAPASSSPAPTSSPSTP